MSETPRPLPHLEHMSGYIPGEQPADPDRVIKLNTNENPYPPSPRVAEAIAEALRDGRLRRYPDPTGWRFREAAARLHGVRPEMVLPGNGSDDCLTILMRAFVGPGDAIAFPTPSYVLYRTLAAIQNARTIEIPFRDDWSIDSGAFREAKANLTFLANPNSPSGTVLEPEAVAELAQAVAGPLVVDEAYADFAERDCVRLVDQYPNVIITRTLSKGRSLAGLRIGYLIARPQVMATLAKVKDSYNCDTLSLLGGAAALADMSYSQETRDRILQTRSRLLEGVRRLGYAPPQSHANFVWCVGGPPAKPVHEALKAQGVYVRLMDHPGRDPGLRVTVGTDEQIDRFLEALGLIVNSFL